MWHPMWEPLWKAVNEVNLPLHFHTFPSLPQHVRDQQTGLTRRAAQFTSVAGFQMNLVNIVAAVIGAAVLERYPNLRISFGESGIGWLPYVLDRMDFEWEDRFRDLGLKMRPSDAPFLLVQRGPSGPSVTKGIRSFVAAEAFEVNRSAGSQGRSMWQSAEIRV